MGQVSSFWCRLANGRHQLSRLGLGRCFPLSHAVVELVPFSDPKAPHAVKAHAEPAGSQRSAGEWAVRQRSVLLPNAPSRFGPFVPHRSAIEHLLCVGRGGRHQAQSCDEGGRVRPARRGSHTCTHRCVLIRPSPRTAPTHLGDGAPIGAQAGATWAPLTQSPRDLERGSNTGTAVAVKSQRTRGSWVPADDTAGSQAPLSVVWKV